MIEEAIAKIESMAEAANSPFEGDNASWVFDGEGNPCELRAAVDEPATMLVHTLSGFADYIKNNFDATEEHAVFVGTPSHVTLQSRLSGRRRREVPLQTEPFPARRFDFGRFLPPEEFVIGLQIGFAHSEQLATVIKFVGNLTAEGSVSVDDDGVSQRTTIRAGVARVGMAEVPNPVFLAPWRTFAEIEQPESPFILRVRRAGEDGTPQAALFETGDHRWQLAAIESIAEYLREKIDLPVFA